MNDGFSDEVAALLRCPVTGQPLHFGTEEDLGWFNLEEAEGAWVTADGNRAYPVRDGFPILVPGEGRER